MQVPSREALLSELDSLGYGARVARAARLGRDGRDSPALTQLMDGLLSGDAYEASLALALARGARDESRVLQALTHPSGLVRGQAAALAGNFIQDDAALERVLPELSPFIRRRVLKGVALARRNVLAARLLPLVLTRHGAAEAALLLPALDADTVRRLLPELEHRLHTWRSLVRRHPDEVLAFIRSRLAHAPERERSALLSTYRVALMELTHSHGEAVLVLARDFSPPDELPRFVRDTLPRLARKHPEQLFALLHRPAYRAARLADVSELTAGLLRQLRFFSHDQRLGLARALANHPYHLARFLDALPPSQRAGFFAHAFEGAPPRELPEDLLRVLPHELRDAEAARQLGLREVREDRDRQLAMQALRTIEHAREPLQKAAFASKAEDRARALSLLVSSTGLSRRGLTETLTYLSRLKNEQDPVRQEALSALAKVPPSIFEPGHIPGLEALVTYVVEARDTSRGTHLALQELAFRLIRAHATAPENPLFRFALDTLKRLAGQSGTLALPPLERDLPHGTEHHLFAALLPMIRSANERDSFGLILTLTQALGRRAWNVDMLQAMLEPITEATSATLAERAIQLWLAPPRTKDLRVRKLLDRDESTVTLAPVFAHLHRRRQEWLDPYLEGRGLKGLFSSSSGKTGWVPRVQRGFHRWLPRQQLRYRDLLLRLAQDTERSAFERMSVLHILARLQVVEVDTLTPFLDSRDVPTVEAALGALVWLDRPEPALPLLLEYLDGDRARVAMYAVPRLAKLVSPGTLATTLGALLSREKLKVTVHKEALRLLGTFRSPRSLALLRQQWDRPQLHRDVRIAVGHAARQLLDDPAAWELLESIARSPDEYVAASLLDAPPGQLPLEARPRYAVLVLQVSRHPELTVRRRAFTVLPGWSAGMEEQVAREAAGRVLDLSSGAEWREAAQALVEATREGKAFEQVVACASRLGSEPLAPDATAERDVPARQRLMGLHQVLLELPRPVRVHLRTRLDEVARVLARDASLWPESAALRLASLEWREARAVSEVLRGLAAETREEPLFAQSLADVVATELEDASAGWTAETLLELADRVGPELPLTAVELISVAGQRLHWREDAASRLRALRQHPSAAVRAAAYATVTASE